MDPVRPPQVARAPEGQQSVYEPQPKWDTAQIQRHHIGTFIEQHDR